MTRLSEIPGAHPVPDGVRFATYAPHACRAFVRLFDADLRAFATLPLEPLGDGVHAATVPAAEGGVAGALYKLVLDDAELPDPYARALPFGVHGPARVLAPSVEPALASPPASHAWVLYELHVGTFSAEGTYRGALAKLDDLVALGVNAIELMPIAAFDGRRGWGYDGVALFAPFAPYGTHDDLRALVRGAHDRGLAVILDVVYNHFGPSGNYLASYAPEYFTSAIQTPWGAAPDFSYAATRTLVLENARYWLEELGFDGLRLDATHAIVDQWGDGHIVAEVCAIARQLTPPRRIFLEDERNDAAFVASTRAGGVWADDLHHQLRVVLTGEQDGYYAAYPASLDALAQCIQRGWRYTGQPYAGWDGRPRGGPVEPLAPENLVVCVENHDQVGNRAFGARLSHDVDVDRYCAAVTLLLFLPYTPLLFMGQEWAASSPFLYFSDHAGELGRSVSRGRREEFRGFSAFADPVVQGTIPDPQAEQTFTRSKLRWDEREHGHHARALAVHREMLRLRRDDPVLSAPATWSDLSATTDGQVLEIVRRLGADVRRLFVSLGGAPHRLVSSGPGAARSLFVSGRFEDGLLHPMSAVVLGV